MGSDILGGDGSPRRPENRSATSRSSPGIGTRRPVHPGEPPITSRGRAREFGLPQRASSSSPVTSTCELANYVMHRIHHFNQPASTDHSPAARILCLGAAFKGRASGDVRQLAAAVAGHGTARRGGRQTSTTATRSCRRFAIGGTEHQGGSRSMRSRSATTTSSSSSCAIRHGHTARVLEAGVPSFDAVERVGPNRRAHCTNDCDRSPFADPGALADQGGSVRVAPSVCSSNMQQVVIANTSRTRRHFSLDWKQPSRTRAHRARLVVHP